MNTIESKLKSLTQHERLRRRRFLAAATATEAQLPLTNRATLFCKVVEVLQDFLSEYVEKFTTGYNVA